MRESASGRLHGSQPRAGAPDTPNRTMIRTMMLHGDRVAYRDEGVGEVLLLIHGMGGSSENWRALVPEL